MIDLDDIVVFMLLASAGAFAWRTTTVREYALRAVKQHLRRLELQLLDETVAWQGVRWQGGRLLRLYQFEFSSMGNERYNGKVIMSGNHPASIELEAYQVERPEHEALH